MIASWPVALATVYRMQLARVRVARVPLLFVAVLQSLGLLLLLRGVVTDSQRAEKEQVVAGAVILVVGFVALNLLAQRFGQLVATRGLDYFAALGVRPAVVIVGTAAAYATFALPGCLLVAAIGAPMYGLALSQLWLVPVAAIASGAALAGLGAVLGLAAPRPEIATVAGQLGMTAVLFLGFVRPDRLPTPARVARLLVPSSYATDLLSSALGGNATAGEIAVRVAACVVAAVAFLALSTMAFRRAVLR